MCEELYNRLRKVIYGLEGGALAHTHPPIGGGVDSVEER